MEYGNLFNPTKIGGKTLKNRIIHASISPHVGSYNGIQEALITYYRNRALGGVAAIVTEPLGVAPHQRPSRITAWNASMEGDLKRFADSIESLDCRLIGQIQDPGRGRHVAGRNYNAIGPSPLPDALSWTMPRPMSVSDIRIFIDHCANSAYRIMKCGFSGVEISAGHGHLFHQFLSPISNKRIDEFGGDALSRAKLLIDLISQIRDRCGQDFLIGIKLPGDDGVRGGIDVAQSLKITNLLTTRTQLDYICHAQGAHDNSLEMHIPDDTYPRTPYLHISRASRSVSNGVPVVALGRITDPAEAEKILSSGDADLIALGRPLIADPEWPIKSQNGKASDIRYCVSCNTCWNSIIEDNPLICDNNPLVGKSNEVGYKPAPATEKRKIVIVGSGIAGLQAAWVASARGHEVTLITRSNELGGKARVLSELPTNESVSSVFDYQNAQIIKYGTHVIYNTECGIDTILSLNPQAVILATGATMIRPSWLPEIAEVDSYVVNIIETVKSLQFVKEKQKGTAVIHDMDHSEGTYCAIERIASLFERTVVVTQRQGIGEECGLTAKQRILRRFNERNIEVIGLSEPRWTQEFEENFNLEIVSVFGKTERTIENVCLLTYATPRRPNNELEESLKQAGTPYKSIGDCKVASNLKNALYDGHNIGEII